MVKKRPPLYQKMLSFTYCKRPLLYHRKFSLTQLSSRSYIIGSSPLTQCRRPLLCKRVLSPRYAFGHIYIKGHSLYLLWVATPISILNNEGGRLFTSAHFQKAATSGFIIQKGVMAKRFLLSQRNMWLEGLSAPHSLYQSWMHYAQAIAEPSRNLSGSHGMASEVSQIHLGAFTISIIHQH